MAGQIEELASPGVHEKVFEIVRRFSGNKVFDAPAGHWRNDGEITLFGKDCNGR